MQRFDRLFRIALTLLIACIAGCTPGPTTTTGRFEKSHTLNLQRGSIDIVVETSAPGTFKITEYRMDHPMGRRPDTEAEFKTPAGKFEITNRKLQSEGVTINGKLFEPTVGGGRATITIDTKGGITMKEPPKEEP